MECQGSCGSFFCKTHSSRISTAYHRYMDALNAMQAAYKSTGGRSNEFTSLALRNYEHEHDVFISTCNDVDTKREEVAFDGNSVQMGPFSPTPELNRALSELLESSEWDAQHRDGTNAAFWGDLDLYGPAPEETVEDDMPAPEEPVNSNYAEGLEHNAAPPENTVEGNKGERMERGKYSNASDQVGTHVMEECNRTPSRRFLDLDLNKSAPEDPSKTA